MALGSNFLGVKERDEAMKFMDSLIGLIVVHVADARTSVLSRAPP